MSDVLVARLEQIISIARLSDTHASGQIADLASRALADLRHPPEPSVAEALLSIAEGIFMEGREACTVRPTDEARILALGIASGAVMRARVEWGRQR